MSSPGSPRSRPKVIKFILLGSSGVGKTSLLFRFCDNRFMQGTVATIGVDFRWKDILVKNPDATPSHRAGGASASSGSTGTNNEGGTGDVDRSPEIPVRVHVWDTAGQEHYMVIAKPYYRHADGILLVYDVTNAETLTSLNRVLEEARDICPFGVISVLVGNKCDSDPKIVEVTKEQGEQWAKRRGIPLFFETSAQNGTHVDEAFSVLAQHVLATQHASQLLSSSRTCSLCQRTEAATMCLVCGGTFCGDCQMVPHDEREPVAVVHHEFCSLPPRGGSQSPKGSAVLGPRKPKNGRSKNCCPR